MSPDRGEGRRLGAGESARQRRLQNCLTPPALDKAAIRARRGGRSARRSTAVRGDDLVIAALAPTEAEQNLKREGTGRRSPWQHNMGRCW